MSLCHQLYTYFSVTINNPDENDMLIVRNPNEKYVRQCVWTNETGNEGTPHVQMWVRLFRNNSLSLIKKLYPRAHIRGIAKDEYNENTHSYAQKDDDTTRGAHVITTNDADKSADVVLYRVVEELLSTMSYCPHTSAEVAAARHALHAVEINWVATKPYYEKVFTSAAYARMKEYLPATFRRIWASIRTAVKDTEQQTNKQDADKVPEFITPIQDINGGNSEEEDESPSTEPSPQGTEDCE